MKKVIRATVTLNAEDEGGRYGPFNEGYCPHLVVVGQSEWLGVRVVMCPELVYPGESRELSFEFMYEPRVDYQSLSRGVKFTMREGNRIIGSGVVID